MASYKIGESKYLENLLVNKSNSIQKKIEFINPYVENILAQVIGTQLDGSFSDPFYTIPITFDFYNMYLRISPLLNNNYNDTSKIWNIHYTLTIEERNVNDQIRGSLYSSIRGEIVDFVPAENLESYINNLKKNQLSFYFLITGQKGIFKNASEFVLKPETIEIY